MRTFFHFRVCYRNRLRHSAISKRVSLSAARGKGASGHRNEPWRRQPIELNIGPPLTLGICRGSPRRLRNWRQFSLYRFRCGLPKPLASRASQAPALPANGKELISAIQKELSRLGYYDGPDSGRWSRAVRLGAREFIRRTGGRHERHPQPSLELLASLQAANLVELEAKPENSSDPHPIRQAELRPAEVPSKPLLPRPSPRKATITCRHG